MSKSVSRKRLSKSRLTRLRIRLRCSSRENEGDFESKRVWILQDFKPSGFRPDLKRAVSAACIRMRFETERFWCAWSFRKQI